jgi:hypothetical protein
VLSGLPDTLLPADSAPTGRAEWVVNVPRLGQVRGSREDLGSLSPSLSPAPGTSRSLVRACQDAIASVAARHGAIRVEAVSAGPATRSREGGIDAPISARILYRRADATQVRQAPVICQLDGRRQVVAIR